MSIFENLETLNVSEECFNDIMDIVERQLSEGHNLTGVVTRAFDKGKIGAKKSVELLDKANKVPSSNDINQNDDGTYNFDNITGHASTKNSSGENKTDERHIDKGRSSKELQRKRYYDSKNNFAQATDKAKRKHGIE